MFSVLTPTFIGMIGVRTPGVTGSPLTVMVASGFSVVMYSVTPVAPLLILAVYVFFDDENTGAIILLPI